MQCGKRERAKSGSRESEVGELTHVLPHNQVVDFRCLRMLPLRDTARVHCHVGYNTCVSSVTSLC
jgi:hypothetical protein